MNVLFEWAKKNWKSIIVGFVLIVCLSSAIFTGIGSVNISRGLSAFTVDIQSLGVKISATGSSIERLETQGSGIAESIRQREERDKQLELAIKRIEENSRRSEEQYNNLTAGVSKIQAGLSGIEGKVTGLGKNFIQLGDSMAGSLDLIREGLSILAKPTK